ncbi:MAG TPA: hypothetical protein VFW63_07415 [Acidimicrobiales bacterium]|nr:hypothetical protein [Acidimicrobiales bacterium]
MTDAEYNPDPDQKGEELDEATGEEYPPDRAPRLEDTGGRVPEAWEADEVPVDDEVELAGDPDVGAVDDEGQLVGTDVRDDRTGPLDPSDEFTGDETLRDYPTERTPRPAEEAALHVEDDDDVV